VERPDPENRAFRHPDPVGWTFAHRARILRALYTLLRWNPQVRVPRAKWFIRQVSGYDGGLSGAGDARCVACRFACAP
jgi:hypothetical protein